MKKTSNSRSGYKAGRLFLLLRIRKKQNGNQFIKGGNCMSG